MRAGNDMPAIDWNNRALHLGVDEMDVTHGEFAALVNCISETHSSEDLQLLLSRLVEHTRGHFAREEELMEECGLATAAEHKADHARVLGDLMRFERMAARGMPQMARAFVTEFLPSWFATHAATMDSDLARCVKGAAKPKSRR